MPRRVERDVREGWLSLPSRRREAARSVSRCTAQGSVGVPEGSQRTSQPDNPDAVGQRPGAVDGQGQEGAPGDRVVRLAPRLDPRAAAGRGAVRGDHRDRGLEPGGRSGQEDAAALPSLDAAIRRTATGSRARVANMFAVFNPPANVRRVCALSYICAKGDPHPNAAGYRAMANAFFAASGYARKP